jgi:hypothetical protein
MFVTFTIFASETTGPIYFETFQSLQLTNIVLLVTRKETRSTLGKRSKKRGSGSAYIEPN